MKTYIITFARSTRTIKADSYDEARQYVSWFIKGRKLISIKEV